MASFCLPDDFLSGPAPNLTKKTVDFKTTKIPEYAGLYAVILDGCLSEDECDLLLRAAEAQTNGAWEQAMINVGGGRQMLATDTRDCGRIIWDDRQVVAKIWNRVKILMGEIEVLQNKPLVTGSARASGGQIWELSRLNERMRFLKYGEGQYFKPHCDGSYWTENHDEMSFYTLHLYLNEATPGEGGNKLKGGATTFHDTYTMDRTFDVEPKAGRVLIFQHQRLVHSGAEVDGGLKYTLRTDIMYRRCLELEDEAR